MINVLNILYISLYDILQGFRIQTFASGSRSHPQEKPDPDPTKITGSTTLHSVIHCIYHFVTPPICFRVTNLLYQRIYIKIIIVERVGIKIYLPPPAPNSFTLSSTWYLHLMVIQKIDSHVWSDNSNLICAIHSIRSTAVVNLNFNSNRPLLLHNRATCSELPSYTMLPCEM